MRTSAEVCTLHLKSALILNLMPRLEVAVHVLMTLILSWAAVSYAGHALENLRARLWVGAAVDTLIWLGAVGLVVWNVRQATLKSKR